jgi:hypothetical protein
MTLIDDDKRSEVLHAACQQQKTKKEAPNFVTARS